MTTQKSPRTVEFHEITKRKCLTPLDTVLIAFCPLSISFAGEVLLLLPIV